MHEGMPESHTKAMFKPMLTPTIHIWGSRQFPVIMQAIGSCWGPLDFERLGGAEVSQGLLPGCSQEAVFCRPSCLPAPMKLVTGIPPKRTVLRIPRFPLGAPRLPSLSFSRVSYNRGWPHTCTTVWMTSYSWSTSFHLLSIRLTGMAGLVYVVLRMEARVNISQVLCLLSCKYPTN